MIGRLIFVFAAAVLLAGCTDADWDHALGYVGLDKQPQKTEWGDNKPVQDASSQAAPAPAAAAPDEWCAEVAKATQAEAADQGFDASSQKTRAQQAYQQCARAPAAAQ